MGSRNLDVFSTGKPYDRLIRDESIFSPKSAKEQSIMSETHFPDKEHG